MLKSELRKKYKELRLEMSEETIKTNSLAIANRLLKLDIWTKDYFHLFLPIEEQKEIDTQYILPILAGKEKKIVVSKSDFSTLKMSHFLLTDETKFIKNKYNIAEPINGLSIIESEIDVVFIPLLAYDLYGNRVGYGKGFYDLFLTNCKPDTIKIGLSYFEPESKISDISSRDIRLDICITPNETYYF